MTRDEIIQRIIEYIDLQLDGSMGEVYEEPYREVFFDLFAEAYRQGLIADFTTRHFPSTETYRLAR